MKILGKFTASGEFAPFDYGRWSAIGQKYRGKNVVVEVKGEYEQRTSQQNRRWWGVTVPVVRELLNRGRDVPLSKEAVHYVLISAFVACDVIDPKLVPGGPPVPVPSKSLPVEAFSKMMDSVEGYYKREHGLIFPEYVDEEGLE